MKSSHPSPGWNTDFYPDSHIEISRAISDAHSRKNKKQWACIAARNIQVRY